MKVIAEGDLVMNETLPFYPVHPGAILQDELKARGIKQKDFARKIGMEAPHLSALIHGTRNISAGIATKLETGLGIPASQWLNLQSQYNLDKKCLESKRLSSLVDGYGTKTLPSAFLSEAEAPTYGTRKSFLVTLPREDSELLKSLSERLGWDVKSSGE